MVSYAQNFTFQSILLQPKVAESFISIIHDFLQVNEP